MSERARKQGRGRERIPSRLHTVRAEPDAGIELSDRETMTWAEIKSQTFNQLSHPGAPLFLIFCGTSTLFSIIAAPIYIPINSAQEFPFLHLLANTFYFLSFFLNIIQI